MSTGVISYLVRSRGFGFIRCSGGREVFFHRSQVQGTTFDLLSQGQNTRFRLGLCTKGLLAMDVMPVGGDSFKDVTKRSSSGGASCSRKPANG